MFRKNRNRLSQALRRLILFTSMKKERAEQGGSGTSFFLIFPPYLAQLDVMPSPAVPDQGNHMEKLKLPAGYEKKLWLVNLVCPSQIQFNLSKHGPI